MPAIGSISTETHCIPTLALTSAVLVTLSGCAGRQPVRPAGAEQLQIVHVRLSGGPQSGFPITDTVVLTAAHGWFVNQPVAAVDGLPLRVCRNQQRIGRDDIPGPQDWVALCALPPDGPFWPNPIDPCIDVNPGDEVWVGGFPHGAGTSYGPDFWDIQPTVVSGRVVEAHSSHPLGQGLIWVEVDGMDYHGMSGGPAAVITPAGPIVFGMFVRARVDVPRFFTGRVLLGAARLDPEFREWLGVRLPE